jgi:hypothetical protein
MDDLDPETADPQPRDENRGRRIAVIAVVAIAAIGAALWFFRDRIFSGEPEAVVQAVPDPVVIPDSGPVAEKSPEEADKVLRDLAANGSSSKLLEAWLASPGILQRITAAVVRVAEGKSPVPVLSFIEIKGPFTVKENGGRLYISPESHARYDEFTSVFTSIDADYAGRAYGQLRPYFDSAFSQVANEGERFDDVLKSAIKRLSEVKIPDGPIQVVEKGATAYAFEDPAQEALSPVEKHVLRLGTKNGRAFQESLRAFASKAF